MGACALILLVLPATAQSQSDAGLGAELTRHLSTMKKDRQVLRFLERHAWLLDDPRFAAEAEPPASSSRVEPEASRAQGRGGADRARAPGKGAPTRICRRREPSERDLPRLRRVLPAGGRRLAVRVGSPHRRTERAVPRPLPDGLERAPALRPRLVSNRAGRGSPPVLRRVRARLEPVVLQALELARSERFLCKVRNPDIRPGSHAGKNVLGVCW